MNEVGELWGTNPKEAAVPPEDGKNVQEDFTSFQICVCNGNTYIYENNFSTTCYSNIQCKKGYWNNFMREIETGLYEARRKICKMLKEKSKMNKYLSNTSKDYIKRREIKKLTEYITITERKLKKQRLQLHQHK